MLKLSVAMRPVVVMVLTLLVAFGPELESPPTGPTIVKGIGTLTAPPAPVPCRTVAPLLTSTRIGPVPVSAPKRSALPPVFQLGKLVGSEKEACPPLKRKIAG